MIRQLRRRAFRALVRALAQNLHRAPRLVLRIADVMAPFVFRRVLDRTVVMRNLIVADHLRAFGYARLRRSIALPDARIAKLPHPLIIGTFHLGALAAVGSMFAELPSNVLVLRATPKFTKPLPHVTIETTRGDEQHRARVFHRAIQFLQDGHFVFVPLDPEESARLAAPFRGRTLQLARGPFALARITGAPILPMIARWNGWSVELVLGEIIPASSDEAQLAAAAAKWLEDYLDRHPSEISERVIALTS
ncbi:MAG TPA: hypothetical protein VHW00_22655 [Thermoanaerobaculia bacterium]|nr:hypothetical protein [Thermoanaerobaculia bacterium]